MSLSSGQISLFFCVCVFCFASCSDGVTSSYSGDSEAEDGDIEIVETDADLDNFDSELDFVERDDKNDEDSFEADSEDISEADTGDSDEADSIDSEPDMEPDNAGESDQFDSEEHPVEILGVCEPCSRPMPDDTRCVEGTWCVSSANGAFCTRTCDFTCEEGLECPVGTDCIETPFSEPGVGICDFPDHTCLNNLIPPENQPNGSQGDISANIEDVILHLSASSGSPCVYEGDCLEGEICDNYRMPGYDWINTPTAKKWQPTFTCRKLCYMGQHVGGEHVPYEKGISPLKHFHQCADGECLKAKCNKGEVCMTVMSKAPRYYLNDPYWKPVGNFDNYNYQGYSDMCLPESGTELKWTCPGDSDPHAGLNYAEPEDNWPIMDHGCVSSPLFLPQPYSYPRTTLLDDGRILITGNTPAPHWFSRSILATLYDPRRHSYTVAPMTIPRTFHSQIKNDHGNVWLIGGENGGMDIFNPVYGRATEYFNPETNLFKLGPLLMGERKLNSALFINNDHIISLGGVDWYSGICSEISGRFYPLLESTYYRGTEVLNVAIPYTEWVTNIVEHGNNEWLAFGGFATINGYEVNMDFNTLITYNNEDYSMSKLPNTGLLRTGGDYAELPDGRLIYVGGSEHFGDYETMRRVSIYDDENGWQLMSGAAPDPIYGSKIVYLDDGNVLIAQNAMTFGDEEYLKRAFYLYNVDGATFYKNSALPFTRSYSSADFGSFVKLQNGAVAFICSEYPAQISHVQLYCPITAECYKYIHR